MSKPKVTKVTGKYFVQNSSSATTTFALQLSPLFFDARAIAISDSYMNFRFTKANVSIVQSTTAAEPCAIGYSPSLPTVNPASLQEVLDMQTSMLYVVSASQMGPPHVMRLSRKQLTQNAVKWFRRGTAFDDNVEIQGLLLIQTTTAFNIKALSLLVEYELELCAPFDPAATASTVRMDPSIAQRLRLLRDDRKEKDLKDIARIDSYVPAPEPIPKWAQELLARDNMVVVTSEPGRPKA